ncbi:glycosyltransferase family 4 protein [Algoriphagus zhangzhouensis]|uniref:Glycosyltransferase involved in cell wall bisynthesis n=1 Tax=Algoriphagus zhangzhouensis TaxID=1073327 RepID=A0A1M7ZI09_9BACT|nr:glycosyltransferase family 4 protein [Algoriphagus zhangzhouensis]TDY44259.1 glycosyltransferase involved in cell wall biosynthesis [Algoriphagus zhangzhouensis]SHO64462.1 Glycosyltransferase involved in cell wall bisynthesis [Algoriphagus zhangzhouensis]
MHIGFLTPEYPHERVQYSAGIGTSLKNLIDSLIKLDCRVSVFVYNQPFFDFIEEDRITLHLISNQNKGAFGWYKNRKDINKYVQYFITTEKIDILEVPDWTGISAFMKFSCPVVMRLHGSDGFFCYLEQRKQKIKNWFLEKKALSSSDALISPNKFTLDTTRSVFGLSDHQKVKIINLGLDLSFFNDPEFESFEPFTICCIGTIIRKKGVFTLPSIFEEVIRLLPNVRFFFIGNDSPDVFSGSESTWSLLEKEFSQPVLEKVTYLGKIDYSEVSSHLKKANLCVFPSKAETTGMVTLEAMAMGKAVITSNEDWSAEIIENGVNGFRLDPTDYLNFAKVAVEILSDREMAIQLGKEARKIIEEEFDALITASKNKSFYLELKRL